MTTRNLAATIPGGTLMETPNVTAAGGPDVSELAMVAVFPREDEAATLAMPGGQDADSLHCTLVFLGAADSFDATEAKTAIEGVASQTPSLSGSIGGAGMFSEGPDGSPSIMLPDVQGLTALREKIVSVLSNAGIESPSEHGFLPHITRSYVASGDTPSFDADPIGELIHFDSVSLVVGGLRTDFSLSGDMQASSLTPNRSSGGKMPFTTEELRDLVPELTTMSDEEIAGVQALIRLTASATVEDPAAEPVTAELTDIVLTAAADGGPTRWQATLLVEDVATEDGRIMAPDSISWRGLPLSLGLMLETPHSDDYDAPACGRIDQIWRAGSLIQASGVFADDAEDPDLRAAGAQAAEAVASRIVRGISVDLLVLGDDVIFVPDETDDQIETEEDLEDSMLTVGGDELVEVMEMPSGRYVYVVTEGVIGSACIVPVPAIAQAQIEVITAAYTARFKTQTFVTPLFAETLVASVAPLKPPAAWFDTPEPDEPTPITITDDGQIYGHAALWSSCHEGFRGRCVPPPKSKTGYSHFHVGAIKTDDGTVVPIGKITLKAPHADISVNAAAARQHYDNTASVGAFVRAQDGKLGIWLAGCVRSDASEELVRDLLANPVSGDWRGGEMVAVHAVPDPGFPVLRASANADDSFEVGNVILESTLAPDPTLSSLAFFKPAAKQLEEIESERLAAEIKLAPLAYFRPGVRVKSAA